MTLIEILSTYADAVAEWGREQADLYVLSGVDETFWKHIQMSVNNRGELIGSFGERFEVTKLESMVDWVDDLTENK